MRPLALLALVLFVAACDTTDTNPPDPPDPYDPPTPIDETALVTATTETALAQYRALWAAEGPDDYRFEVFRLCTCLENRIRYVVTVRGGQAREATRTTSDGVTTTVAPASVPYPTVEAVFDALQAGFDSAPDAIEGRYRPADGLPAHVFVDPDAGRSDDELHLTVAGFDAL